MGPVRGDTSAGVAREAAWHRLLAHASSLTTPIQLHGKGAAIRRTIATVCGASRSYEYRDAATLLADFWTMVDGVLRERGVIP